MDTREVREALKKQPFQPFIMHLADGRKLEVTHPEFVAVSPRRVVVINNQDEWTSILEPLLIVSLEFAGTEQLEAPAQSR